jgi:hypothetical protein
MHRRRIRARAIMRHLLTLFGEQDALTEVRNRKQAKLLLRQFMRS